MKLCTLIRCTLLAVLVCLPAQAHALSEREATEIICAGMLMEKRLNVGRVDCLNTTHAIEVDFSNKWKEALGQSLAYAADTGKNPGIYLICRSDVPAERCKKYEQNLAQTINAWRLSVDVWHFRIAGNAPYSAKSVVPFASP